MTGYFSLPSLPAGDEKTQLRALYDCLRRTVQQLNLALGQLPQPQAAAPAQTPAAQETFAAIKGLIIKSADIVEHYAQQLEPLLLQSGSFVAQSEFGTYRERTDQQLTANGTAVTQALSKTAQVEAGLDSWLKNQSAYLRYGAVGTTLDETGLAQTDAPGIEIGDFQTLEQGTAVTVNRRFARFTAYGLELFGARLDRPIAYLSGDKLHITDARVLGDLQLGGYLLSSRSGLAFSWVGGDA